MSSPISSSITRLNAVVSHSVLFMIVCAFVMAQPVEVAAQQKLPAPEKIVDGYLKAIGGKKRVGAIRDATYEWAVASQSSATAKKEMKAPASVRVSWQLDEVQRENGASASSVWERGAGGEVRTLTGAEANVAKLSATLDASRLVNYKKLNVLARTVAMEQVDGEPVYTVEFSLRNGARLRYSFSAKSKLLLKIADANNQMLFRFGDYRVAAGGVILEPHRIERAVEGAGLLSLTLQRVRYNAGLTDAAFDAPRGEDALDVVLLLREVESNQSEIDERVGQYTFLQKATEREINGRGEIKKEKVQVYEVFPVPGREPVFKLVSENGVALSAERIAKEEKRVGEELEKAERERAKEKDKRERELVKRQQSGTRTENEDREPGIGSYLRVCEFVSPRRERFREREAVVFDFRPRAGYKPKNREEEIISKLVGVVWIDPIDKQVMRLEAKLAEGFKIGGGLVFSVRPGAAFVIEQTRMSDGVWLPLFAQANLSYKVLLFGGGDINKTLEWSNYQRFDSETKDYKLNAPATNGDAPKP